MPGKRSTTPLFDLLQQGRARGVEVRIPEPDIERPRLQAPEQSRGEPRHGVSRFVDSPIRVSDGVVQMPIGYAAAALTVALLAVVLAWVVAYKQGEARVKQDQALLESVMGPSSRITEPGEAEQKPETGDTPGEREAPRGEAAPAGPARFITAQGGTSTDPRQPDHNYLHLAAKLDLAGVQSAMAALESRGIDSFAEIDPGTVRRKNGPLYTLIAAKGVPGSELGGTEARRYREQVVAAGAAWKKDGGIWDFADAYWKKYP